MSFLFNMLAECPSLQQFHADKNDLVALWCLVPKKIKDSARIWVGHLPRKMNLALKAGNCPRLSKKIGNDGFNRYMFMQLKVLCFIDLPHSSCRYEAHNAKAACEDFSGRKGHTGRRTGGRL